MIKDVIRALRKRQGLSQAELAEKLGLEQAAISQYETGRAKPSVEVIAALGLLANDEEKAELDAVFGSVIQHAVDRVFTQFAKRAVGEDDWRVGRNNPLNIYAGDRPVCQCHSAEDAKLIVFAVNALRAQKEQE